MARIAAYADHTLRSVEAHRHARADDAEIWLNLSVAGHLILSIEEAERLLAALPGAIEDARAGNRACGGGRVVSAPVAKRAGAGPTAFADGSMAVWRPDLGRWTVAAGADLAMNDPAVPCEAAEFCALRNAGGGRADGGGATPLAIIAQVLAALPNAVQADAAQVEGRPDPLCRARPPRPDPHPHPQGDQR